MLKLLIKAVINGIFLLKTSRKWILWQIKVWRNEINIKRVFDLMNWIQGNFLHSHIRSFNIIITLLFNYWLQPNSYSYSLCFFISFVDNLSHFCWYYFSCFAQNLNWLKLKKMKQNWKCHINWQKTHSMFQNVKSFQQLNTRMSSICKNVRIKIK